MLNKFNPLWIHLFATGLVAASASLAVAKPVVVSPESVSKVESASSEDSTVKTSAEAPFTSQSVESFASSAIAPAVSPQLGFDLSAVRTASRVTDPQTAAKLAEQSAALAEQTAKLAAAGQEVPKVKPAIAPSGPSQEQLKLLAKLEAELNATELKLNKVDAQLSSGQTQLVRVAGMLEKELLQGGPDARGLHPFVRVAQRYAGTPYVWGGESARGFDCSGFIIRVMRDLGYKALPHSAAEQFRYGIPVATQNLRPGDLVFFANTYKPGISHVGIYLGKSRFIHAAGTGLGTIVSSLNAGKYRAKYAGARRLVLQKS